jgi:hypothetical protein
MLSAMDYPLAKRHGEAQWDLPEGAVQTGTGKILEAMRKGEFGGQGYWVGWKGKYPYYLYYIFWGSRYMLPRDFIYEAYKNFDYDTFFKNQMKERLKNINF